MSGQPYRYNKDVENFRNEYMDALNLISNINDMNLQANKNYKETGALPPQSSMKDNRTTAEILADVEKLKLSIISEFKGLCTPNMAMGVIQKVQESPLNADGSFLIWLAQNSTELVTQLKRKYKFGIEGNENDVNTMYLFLQSIYSKSKEMNSTVKSAFDRPTGGLNGGIQPGDLDALKRKYEEIQYRLLSKSMGGLASQRMRDINDKFNALSTTITTDIYEKLKSIFLQSSKGTISYTSSKGTNSYTQTDINRIGYSDWIEFTDKLPSSSSLNALLDQLEKSERNSNPDLSIKILSNINSMLPTLADIQEADRISDNIIKTNGRPLPPTGVITPGVQLNPTVQNPTPPIGTTAPATTQQKLITRTLTNKIANSINNFLSTQPSSGDNVTDDHAFGNEFTRNIHDIETEMDGLYPDWEQTINYDAQILADAVTNLTHQFNFDYSSGEQFTGEKLRAEIKRINSDFMIGSGLRRKGRPKGSGIVKPLHQRIDSNMGIKQGHTHVPFGKYLLNKNRLDEDIFSFKHNKGYGVRGYPSKRISRNLSNIFKTIVGGGTPKFDELSNLSNDEKVYLHTVSKKAGIMDKISIPTPSKDAREKDIHQFEVMKGEILAGNDSSVLIKNFKLLLLKLSKNGSLPKNEVSEIMEDLLTLGY
jgi:hypothetical protein